MNKVARLGLLILLAGSCTSNVRQTDNAVTVVGQMRNVMWKGQLSGTIYLDTLTNKNNLYGLGPVEYLTGELLILDGTSYESTVISDTIMKVAETYDVSAPFFAYATIPAWTSNPLPDTIESILQLERFLDKLPGSLSRPFMFRLSGSVERAMIHVVNLPKGSQVSSPDDSHEGQLNDDIHDVQVEILGFFSKNHRGIFTHHDSFVHMHLITADLKKMGHLDEVHFRKGSMTLNLPSTK